MDDLGPSRKSRKVERRPATHSTAASPRPGRDGATAQRLAHAKRRL